VHDTTWLEIHGTPALFLASSAFEDAAKAQATQLGLPQVRRAFVPHPIQDQTDDEMRARADAVINQALELLLRPDD
jgi:hypothetical protein